MYCASLAIVYMMIKYPSIWLNWERMKAGNMREIFLIYFFDFISCFFFLKFYCLLYSFKLECTQKKNSVHSFDHFILIDIHIFVYSGYCLVFVHILRFTLFNVRTLHFTLASIFPFACIILFLIDFFLISAFVCCFVLHVN